MACPKDSASTTRAYGFYVRTTAARLAVPPPPCLDLSRSRPSSNRTASPRRAVTRCRGGIYTPPLPSHRRPCHRLCLDRSRPVTWRKMISSGHITSAASACEERRKVRTTSATAMLVIVFHFWLLSHRGHCASILGFVMLMVTLWMPRPGPALLSMVKKAWWHTWNVQRIWSVIVRAISVIRLLARMFGQD